MTKEELDKHLWNLWSLSGGKIGKKPPEKEMKKWDRTAPRQLPFYFAFTSGFVRGAYAKQKTERFIYPITNVLLRIRIRRGMKREDGRRKRKDVCA